MMFGLEGHVVCSTLSCRHESRWWMDNYHQLSAWKLLARWLIFLRRGVLFHLLENAAMTTLLNARKHMQIPSNTCMSQFILFGSNLNSLKSTNPASMVPVGGTALVQNCWRAAQCSRGEDFRSILCFHKTFPKKRTRDDTVDRNPKSDMWKKRFPVRWYRIPGFCIFCCDKF